MNTPQIQTQGLNNHCGASHILRGIDFTVNPGETICTILVKGEVAFQGSLDELMAKPALLDMYLGEGRAALTTLKSPVMMAL